MTLNKFDLPPKVVLVDRVRFLEAMVHADFTDASLSKMAQVAASTIENWRKGKHGVLPWPAKTPAAKRVASALGVELASLLSTAPYFPDDSLVNFFGDASLSPNSSASKFAGQWCLRVDFISLPIFIEVLQLGHHAYGHHQSTHQTLTIKGQAIRDGHVAGVFEFRSATQGTILGTFLCRGFKNRLRGRFIAQSYGGLVLGTISARQTSTDKK